MKHCVSAVAFMAAVAAIESVKDMALTTYTELRLHGKVGGRNKRWNSSGSGNTHHGYSSKVLISKVSEEVFITKKADRSSSGGCRRLW